MAARAQRKGLTVFATLGMLAAATLLVVYSVPLYRLFCQVTGYGGTTQRVAAAPATSADRVITVRFEASVNANLPWKFRPAQREIKVKVGARQLAHYVARNEGDKPITGVATFNVTPAKAGVYFSKIACFCFDEQRLAPGQRADMPVSFFIDPAILKDRNLDEVSVITLSYTFFRSASSADATVGRGPGGRPN